MQITNKAGLPQAFVDAVKADDYDPGESDISVTSLIAPPRLVALRRANEAALTEDASERLWSLQGQIIHSLLERANVNDLVQERQPARVGVGGRGAPRAVPGRPRGRVAEVGSVFHRRVGWPTALP